MQTTAWAAQRLGLPVTIAGGSKEEANVIADALHKAGVKTDLQPSGGGGKIRLRWVLPREAEE